MIIYPPKRRRKRKIKKNRRPLSLAEQQERRLNGKKDIVYKGKRLWFQRYSDNNSYEYKSKTYEVDSIFGVSGIYFLLNENMHAVYIGESMDCVWRIGQHYRDGVKDFKFVKIFRFDGTDTQRKAIEKKLIKEYNPIYNKQHNGFDYK